MTGDAVLVIRMIHIIRVISLDLDSGCSGCLGGIGVSDQITRTIPAVRSPPSAFGL